ncbi:hypothetical protein CR513_35383, partial [Mucuna pruriens]
SNDLDPSTRLPHKYIDLCRSCDSGQRYKQKQIMTDEINPNNSSPKLIAVVWMGRVLGEIGHSQSKCTAIMCDNSSTIKPSRNPCRGKHIDVRFHFLRDLTKEEVAKLVHSGTSDQVGDDVDFNKLDPVKVDDNMKAFVPAEVHNRDG